MHILFHRRTPWNGEVRCSTNIFASMAIDYGMTVSYLPGTMHIGRVLKKSGNYNSWKKGFRHEAGATVYTPFSLVPFLKGPLLSSPLTASLSYKSFIPPLRNVFKKHRLGSPDVIWTVPPGSSAIRSEFPKARLIHQVVDYYPSHFGDRIRNVEKQDYARADHILTIGHAMKEYIVDELGVPERKITILGQGVDVSRFDHPFRQPEEYQGIEGPIGVWIGVCSKMDRDLCDELARVLKTRKGYFFVIGPKTSWSDAFAAKHENVLFLGKKHPDAIVDFLRGADLGIMLYDQSRQDVYKGQHPLKLYEYAAAGLAILSTPHEEFRYLDVPALIVKRTTDIEPLINQALSNMEEWRSKAVRFASAHPWESAFEKAMESIFGIKWQKELIKT